MATSVRLIRRYVWLVDTLRRNLRLSLDEINKCWHKNYTLNPDHETEIPERTFHRHREAILDLFDLEIACDRASNTYYIKDSGALERPSFASWLFNGLALDNQLISNEAVKKRIVYEEIPGGIGFLPVIVEALSENRVLSMSYRSFNKAGGPNHLEIEPIGLKQYRRRWYLIGSLEEHDNPLTFALDRMETLLTTDKTFEHDNKDNFNEIFSEVVGVNVDSDFDVEDVVVRVYGKQRNYFEGTPLHHSQTKINETKEYSDYKFLLRPEYEFQHEILRVGPDAEVLTPKWLRDEMQWNAIKILERYKT